MFEKSSGSPLIKGRSSGPANPSPMPIFEYSCNKCEQRFEKLLRKSDQEVDCPKCRSTDLRKLFSSFASPSSESSDAGDFCPPGGCGSCPNPGMCMN